MTSAESRYIPFVDGLRAIAVLSVIAYHLDEDWLPGGFVGVDVFFVISGFVISRALANTGAQRLGGHMSSFYARRLRRIAPALIVCLLGTALARALFVPDAWLSEAQERTGLWAFFGVSNFQLLDTQNGYFDPAVELNPYTHTWSLGVEEQFYLIFPLLFFAWVKARRTLAIGLIAAGLIGSLAFAAAKTDSPDYSFYMLTTRFWELAAGALLYMALSLRPASGDAGPRAPWLTAGAAASAILLIAGTVIAREGRAPFPDALPAVLGTVGVIGFLYGRDQVGGVVRGVLENDAVVGIGKLSYSLYLWHWPVFVLFRWTAGLESVATRVVALALVFGLALASYEFVEKPFRYGTFVRRAPRLAVIGGAIAIVCASAAAYDVLEERRGKIALSVVSRNVADWYPTDVWPKVPVTCPAPGGLTGGAQIVRYSRSGCRTEAPRGRLFVAGDSHALAYSAMLREIAARGQHEVLLYFTPGCGFITLRPGDGRRNPGCGRLRTAIVQDIARRIRSGDILFLPSLRIPRLTRQFGAAGRPGAGAGNGGAEPMRRAAERLAIDELRAIEAKGARIVFEAPPPLFRAPAFRCADWFNRGNPVCEGGLEIPRATIERLRAPVLDSFERIREELGTVEVWDPLPVLCPGAVCGALRGERPLLFDGDHLSAYSNRLLLPHFESGVTAGT